MTNIASRLASAAAAAAELARNEAQLRHELEAALKEACEIRSIPWTPFQLERALKESGKPTKFADVAHGAVIIEYEPPKSFAGKANGKARHARAQAEEYSILISAEEGRRLEEYVLVIWDGSHISFGHHVCNQPQWNEVAPFDSSSADKLLTMLERDGRPLVHPQLLRVLVGPDSEHGIAIIPILYASICEAMAAPRASKTKMLFTEWRRLFSQVAGFQPENMKSLLARQEISHNQPYDQHPAAYLFALNTYIAIIAKVVAACALPNPSQNLLDPSVPVAKRLRAVETGALFDESGILNMLSGDFFAWYLDDRSWGQSRPHLEALIAKLSGVDFTIAKKHPGTTRDLFKGIYERFIPREVRHALGEFYTPDWLAEHGLDLIEWNPDQPLTDPTCGSGTFLLEALRRRRLKHGDSVSARTLLAGLNGIDLNPLAVLVAKGSLAVFLSPFLDPSDPIRLPVYLADAINPASMSHGLFPTYSYVIQTEMGPKEFSVPPAMIDHDNFFKLFAKIRMLIDADFSTAKVISSISSDLEQMALSSADIDTIGNTVGNLISLHEQGWNGIWCAILADRFAAGAIPPSCYVCGNPPWVKWSNLPEEYTRAIQDECRRLGVFSSNTWVGGIESDISTVVTYQAIYRYLAPSGRLGFFLPGSVFTTPSSAGFRKFSVGPEGIECKVLLVEDFDEVKPFDGVTNLPRFLAIQRNATTIFPVIYRKWIPADVPASKLRLSNDAESFRRSARYVDCIALPVPGGDSGRPWLVGSARDQAIYSKIFSGKDRMYQARKGVTADRNGVFWVSEISPRDEKTVTVRNAASIGKTKGIPEITAPIEKEHLFPLLRGQGVKPFCAAPEKELRIIVPQRGMHGDPDLPINAPFTFKFLSQFRPELERRSSLKRFQKGQAFYSLWSTGPYTFAPFKVLWREIGKCFAAAYVGSAQTQFSAEKPVIPDHKLYFIPVETEQEAAYLTGFLNAPIISGAISAYASQLSLGVSVAEYLNIPRFDAADAKMTAISEISSEISRRQQGATAEELQNLDQRVKDILAL